MRILAIDPGTTESGYCFFENGKILESGVAPNEDMITTIKLRDYKLLAVEMIASYGMAVGQETFDTCVWIGRFVERSKSPHKLVFRKDVKIHLCGTMKAKDPNIRQAIIDKLGAPGTKKEPGGTYGVKSHAWSAVAVALTAQTN